MMVEALWRNLKRLVLHNYSPPPVDLAVYALVHGSIPPYRITLSRFLHARSGGRPKGLSNMQEAFKKSWQRLQTVPIKGTYITDVTQWKCDCGSQKYHAHLLCKHLVQAVGDVPPSWWSRVHRFYTAPFYAAPRDGQLYERPLESDRPCTSIAIEIDNSDDDEVEDLVLDEDSCSRSSEPINSLPAKPPPTGRDSLMRTRAGGGAGFELDDEDEREIDELINKLERAVVILKEQRPHYSQDPRFLRNAMKVFRPGLKLVDKVTHHEARRTMPVTNGSASSRRSLPASLEKERKPMLNQPPQDPQLTAEESVNGYEHGESILTLSSCEEKAANEERENTGETDQEAKTKTKITIIRAKTKAILIKAEMILKRALPAHVDVFLTHLYGRPTWVVHRSPKRRLSPGTTCTLPSPNNRYHEYKITGQTGTREGRLILSAVPKGGGKTVFIILDTCDYTPSSTSSRLKSKLYTLLHLRCVDTVQDPQLADGMEEKDGNKTSTHTWSE
ncbi:hypothetical protein BC835DRAFT_1424816 [Cytidiella melzeri]|nr:hypothetical protein BC835DRAFT_1424816 [Cytidiella melzeri]